MIRPLLVLPLLLAATAAPAHETGCTLAERFADRTSELALGLLREAVPELEALRDRLKDASRYELPEVLPNGDILIRRRPAPPGPGEIDI